MMEETVLTNGVLPAWNPKFVINLFTHRRIQPPTTSPACKSIRVLLHLVNESPFGRCNYEKIILSLARLNTSDLTCDTTLSRYHPTQRRQCHTRAGDWF